MYLFKKQLLFLSLLFTQATIQSASFFQNAQGNARITEHFNNTYEGFSEDNAKDIIADELFIVIDPDDNHAKLAFYEQKPNRRYQVNFFILRNPNISAEFSNEEEAKKFLYDFMVQPPVIAQVPIHRPNRSIASGYDWRAVPATRKR
jgi:hypothetical protein